MSKENKDDKSIIDVEKINFDGSGKYELEEIVDPDFLQQVGGGWELPDINASAQCGDQNTGGQSGCGTDIDIGCGGGGTNIGSCPQRNKNCDCGEDGDDE